MLQIKWLLPFTPAVSTTQLEVEGLFESCVGKSKGDVFITKNTRSSLLLINK